MESLNAMYLCMPITFPTVAIPMNAYIYNKYFLQQNGINGAFKKVAVSSSK